MLPHTNCICRSSGSQQIPCTRSLAFWCFTQRRLVATYLSVPPSNVMQSKNRWNWQFVLKHWYQLPIYTA